MTKRRKALTLLSSAAVLAIGAAAMFLLTSYKAEAVKTDQPVEIRTVKTRFLRPSPQTVTITAEGFLQPARSLDLYSPVSGRVAESLNGLKGGTQVEKGDLLLVLDDRRARLAFENSRTEMIGAVSRFIGSAAMDDAGRQVWNRYLADLAAADFDRLPDAPPSNSRITLLSATMGVAAARHALESAALDLTDHRLRAPFEGTLSGAGVQEEAWVVPGSVLATLVETGKMILPMSIPSSELKHFSAGDSVVIQGDDEERHLKGVVDRIEPLLTPGSQTVMVYAVFDKTGDDGTGEDYWIPGTFVSAGISGLQIESAYRVPRGILVNESLPVYADGRLELLPVRVLARDGGDILLAPDYAGGIELVETVIQNPIEGLPLRRENSR